MKELWEKTIEFHGHTCPGIAMGFKICEGVIKKMGIKPQVDELICVSENNTCPADAVRFILNCTEENNRLDYNEKIIEDLYVEYQGRLNNSYEDNTEAFFESLIGKNILLLGPGKTIALCQEKINEYIKEKNPVVIAINFYPEHIKCDYIFISNVKRYDLIMMEHRHNNSESEVVITNNVLSESRAHKYVLSYNKLLDNTAGIRENGLIMCLNGLVLYGINSVNLAGFDGFSTNGISSYYSEYLELSDDYKYLLQINENVRERVKKLKENMDIVFWTSSLYDDNE